MTHLRCQELLPWYATLDEERRRELDAHTGSCPECARELEALHALQQRLAPLQEIPEPSAVLLQRTLARIDTYERQKAAQPVGWRRVTAWWSASAVPVRVLVGAQAVLILLLGLSSMYFYRQAEEYSTASGPAPTVAGTRLTVAFQPAVSEAALRQALREVKGTIVDGPSALGIYTVRIPTETDANQVLARLRANTDVVRFAEKMPER